MSSWSRGWRRRAQMIAQPCNARWLRRRRQARQRLRHERSKYRVATRAALCALNTGFRLTHHGLLMRPVHRRGRHPRIVSGFDMNAARIASQRIAALCALNTDSGSRTTVS